MKMRVLSLGAVILTASLASANVSQKNGNFFIGYTDVVYPGGFEPKVERVYNAKTPFKGMFGWGWGSEYEVYLTVSADGSVVVHEFGGGETNQFNPTAFNAQELEKAVDMIAKEGAKSGAYTAAAAMADYRRKLKSDSIFRTSEWEHLVQMGKLKPRQLTEGTKLTSNRFGHQFITRLKQGYARVSDNGKLEKFDERGKLVRIQDKNNNFIDLSYTSDGKLQKLVDNFNRKMFFSFNQRGLIEKIQGENAKEAAYKYGSEDDLIWSKDVDGNAYSFKYSNDHRHNMVEIGYSDKTTMQISYYPQAAGENVRSVKDRDGTTTEYAYNTDRNDKDHSLVSINVKGSDGKSISASKYEYYFKHKADGQEWTYKQVADLDGDRTETTYNECCGLPLLIKRGGEETSFEYDIKGHVTKKVTPVDVTHLSYDPTVGKVTKVERFSKADKKDTSWSTFKYDDKGNLVFAKNSQGKGVQLFYDANGRIKTLRDQNQRRIDFKYNENSKPVEITDPALGTINVTYNNAGEIKKVESAAGRKIALQVTSAFQNLLDIIRPAGVTLSF